MQQLILKFAPLFLIATPLLAHAEFAVKSVRVQVAPNQLVLNSNLDLSINQEIENALNKGITFSLAIECTLYRKRPIIWDKRIQHWRFQMNMRYHALSGRYIVGGDAQQSSQSFPSAEAALQFMGDSKILHLPLSRIKYTKLDDKYILAFRARLDIESLPAPLRPIAYTSTEWRLSTPWTQWTLQN